MVKNEITDKLEKIEKYYAENPKPLTLIEAAKYLGLSRSSMYKLTFQNQITHYKPNGKLIYFTKPDLNSWLFRNKRQSKYDLEKDTNNNIDERGQL